jgi:hypothetical protein
MKMADYKDIISGTISTLVGKAKEFAASDTVAGIVGKVKSVAEETGVAKVYEDGANRTKAYAKIAKLTLALNGEREELNRVYAEIGKLYFEQQNDAPEGYFAPLFAQARELAAGIAAKETEIQSLKDEFAVKAEESADAEIADFEQIVDATGSDGAAAEDKAEAAEDKVEE